MTESNIKHCFRMISEFSLRRKTLPSIHMPMIWWGLPNPQLERIVLKCITTQFLTNGLDVYIYHYRRGGQTHGSKVTQPSKSNLSQFFSRKYSYSNSPPKKKSKVEIVDDDEVEDEAEEDNRSEEEDFTETETETEDDEIDLELTDEEDNDEMDDD